MRRLLIILAIAFLGLPTILHAQEAPRLEVPIPGIELTSLIKDSDSITVPWLAQYVSGAYTFLISIAGMLAAVMMVIGGFQYVTSAGDKSKIGAAKTRMINALTGLVLVFGSYTVLYAINPNLVKFEGLKIAFVKQDPMMEALMTTTATTSDPPTSGISSETQPQSSSGAPATADGPFSGTIYKTCPLTLADKSMNGIPEFMNQIRAGMGTIVDAKTPMDKVVQIGNIASACDMHLGNCGKSVGTFYALAGVLKEPTCNQNSTNNADCNAWPDVRVHSVPDSTFVWWARCDNEQAIAIKDEVACGFTGRWQQNPSNGKNNAIVKACAGKCGCTRSDCATGQFEAAEKVAADLLNFAKTEPKMAGWPDSWLKDIKRGDWIIMYNGNDDPTGGHSAMFVGWANKDTMITLNGDAKHGIHYSRQCVSSNCPKSASAKWGIFHPITRILRQKGY